MVLALDPAQANARKLWYALNSEERQAAITSALGPEAPPEVRTFLLQRASVALSTRPQTIADDPGSYAARLERAFQDYRPFIFALLFHVYGELFHQFCNHLDSVNGTAAQQGSAVTAALVSQHAPREIAAMLLAVRIVREESREAADACLFELCNTPLETLLARAGMNAPGPTEAEDTGLGAEIDALEARFAALADQLQDVVGELRGGVPPDEAVARAIVDVVGAYRSVVEALQAEAYLMDNDALPDISGLRRAWKDREARRIAAAGREALRGQARVILQAASTLTSDHEATAEAIAPFTGAVREMQERLYEDAPDPEWLERLVQGTHPVALVVSYLDGELDPDSEAALDDWLRAEHGAVLARAVLARRIRIGTPLAEPRIDGARVEADAGSSPETGPEQDDAADGIESAVEATTTNPGTHAEEEIANEVTNILPDGDEVTATGAGFSLGEEFDTTTSDTSAEAPAEGNGMEPSHAIAEGVSSTEAAETQMATDAPAGPLAEASAPVTIEAPPEFTPGEMPQAGPAEPAPDPAALAEPTLFTPDTDALGVNRAIWCALAGDQPSLAYQLAVYSGTREPAPTVLASLVLGREIRSPVGEIAQVLRTRFEAAAGTAYTDDRPTVFLLTAAALRPGLLAPMTGASALLRDLGLGLAPLHDLAETVARYGERLNGLDPAALSGALSLTHWRAQMEELQREARDFLERAASRSVKYARATDVWRHWVREGGMVHQLLAPVIADDEARATWLAARQAAIDVAAEAQATMREIHPAHREKIIARALEQLEKFTAEALDISGRWLRLRAVRPNSDDFLHRTIAEARTELLQKFPEARAALNPLVQSPDARVSTAAGVLARSIEDLEAMFVVERALSVEPRPAALLSAALLRTELVLDDDRVPEADSTVVCRALLQAVDAPADWGDAFARRVIRSELGDARRIVDLVRDQGGDGAEGLTERWRDEVRSGLDSLEHDLEVTRRALDEHVVQGLLTESDRARLDAGLVAASRHVDVLRRSDEGDWARLPAEDFQFARLHAHLHATRTELAERRETRHAEIRARMDSARLSPEAVARVEELLRRGDALTAEEYINLGAQGDFPDEEDAAAEMPAFFPEAARAIEEVLQHGLDPLPRQLRAQRNVAGLPMYRVPGAQAEQAAVTVEAWAELKSRTRLGATPLERVLSFLGFRGVQIDAGASGWEVVFRTAPVCDRREIPTEFYGSRAGGKYRVIGVWNRPSEEELLSRVGDTHQKPPTLVLYFGRMTEQRRRGLARLARERRRTFVLLDETLLVYLCAQRGARLPVFFGAAMPFAHSEPYITTGSLVPPEMFFGREHERDEILSQRGSSFLYGGRQLGKTALLKHVERMYHDPGRGWVVRWIDLRNQGIGLTQGTEEIWPLVVRELAAAGVVPSRSAASTRTPERVFEHVTAWLNVAPDRRIVLLLDEADRFLHLDAREHFPHTSKLKNLMETTDRRFKVVFAGLHNVVRTTHQANHPLGHFGDPIAIGPLFNNGQVRAARALVEEPYRLLGYRFESPELVFRILAQTNYYPSLIQLYGHHLLRHLQRRFDERTRGADAGPPFVITREQVDEVYRGRDLRTAIEQRFALTLELDPRYEVVAYALANAVLEERVALEDGAPPERLRHEALYWWPAGFKQMSGEDFRVLLDEMVALGVLRHTGRGGYSLRSANVSLLMGNEERVLDVLLNKRRELPVAYDAAAFRERIGEAPPRMSPLTHQQISHLRTNRSGVTVIAGSDANGLSAVPGYLQSVFGFHLHLYGAGPLDFDFARWLDLLELDDDAPSVVYVGAEHPWDPAWVDHALLKIGRLRTRRLRVVFALDPGGTWAHMDDLEALAGRGVVLLELMPWHDSALGDWLEAQSISVGGGVREHFRQVTGGRPYLVDRYLARHERGVRWEQALAEVESELGEPEAQEQFCNALGIAAAGNAGRLVLRALAQWGEPVGVADLASLVEAEGGDPGEVERVLRWAEVLHLAQQVEADVWAIDPLVVRMAAGDR
ncbi:MAG TPA: AAA family ATPase [Longimicrobium sp.]|nr:AAA family ATPase [Longimicrobium sp.]